jgi:membrane protease YdiL (CAAX protease family)
MLSPTTRQYWGPWPTLGFGALFAFVFLTVGGIAMFGVLLVATFFVDESHPDSLAAYLREGALLWSLWAVAIAQCAVVYGVIRFRRGATVLRYLALNGISLRTLITWLGMATLLIAVSDLTQLAIGRPVVPAVMVEQYLSTRNLPLFWSVVIVAGPLWEEVVFRGFLMTGFLNSRLGTAGSILLTTLPFAIMHGQYDLFGVASVFATGLLLGIARIRTDSVVTCIAMHAFGNLIAMVETAAVAGRLLD